MIGQAVSEEKIFENGGRTDDGRTTDGRTTEHGYTISSPCEPDGSGELINVNLCFMWIISIMFFTVQREPGPSFKIAFISLGLPGILQNAHKKGVGLLNHP